MRRIPTDQNGKPVTPPAITPLLNSRVIDECRTEVVTQTRSYELITPLFGGGSEPGKADSDMVIRGSGIRGQLRFWWRACRGGGFNGDLGAMKKAEDRLWGARSKPGEPRPSKVQVCVKVTEVGNRLQPFEIKPRGVKSYRAESVRGSGIPPYAVFPLQPKEEDVRRYGIKTTIHPVLDNVKFDLVITFPERERAEVEAALWAWETFGGVGGRTRRGFGAIRLVAVDGKPVESPKARDIEVTIREDLRKHVIDGRWPDGVPHLSKHIRMVVSPNHSDAKKAWQHLVNELSRFRQQRNLNSDGSKRGRSRWPEPDEIRRLTGFRSLKHARELSTVRKFPRAAFGLPIMFHFKDEREGDPPTTMLEGGTEGYQRLASPLILRPLACEGGRASGLAVILEGTCVEHVPGGLVLKESVGEKKKHAVNSELTTKEASEIGPLRGNTDVLDAFLKLLK